jgi:hypothetical protein
MVANNRAGQPGAFPVGPAGMLTQESIALESQETLATLKPMAVTNLGVANLITEG